MYLHKNIDLPAEIALYYGFNLCQPLAITKEDIKIFHTLIKPELEETSYADTSGHFPLYEKVALFRMYREKNLENSPQPIMLYLGEPIVQEDACHKTQNKTKPNSENLSGKTVKSGPRERTISLEIIGLPASIAEILLIKTSIEILKEHGAENPVVRLNSIGDRDTVNRFTRDIIAYYRKNINELPAHCRQIFKKDPLALLSCPNEKCQLIKNDAPKTMNFLSEPSREHFKEVLEHLEALEIPYEIDPFLVCGRGFACQTIFEIVNGNSCDCEKPLAFGIRYANLAKKLGLKRDLPGIGVRLSFTEKNKPHNRTFLKPKIYFIQLGIEAKFKSLNIIETLRKEKIPVYQAISRDKLSSQLSMAESMKIPYTIIMGQKEALEDSIIVRNMSNRSQETVKICDLAEYLKKL